MTVRKFFLLVHPDAGSFLFFKMSSHLHFGIFHFIIILLKFNVVCAEFGTRRLFSHPSAAEGGKFARAHFYVFKGVHD